MTMLQEPRCLPPVYDKNKFLAALTTTCGCTPWEAVVIIPTICRSTLMHSVESVLRNNSRILTVISFNGEPPAEVLEQISCHESVWYSVIADRVSAVVHAQYLYGLVDRLGDIAIGFLHDDDMFSPYYIDHCLHIMSSKERIRAVCSKTWYFSAVPKDPGFIFPRFKKDAVISGPYNVAIMFYYNPICTPTLIAKASAYPDDHLLIIRRLGGLHDFWLGAYFAMLGLYCSDTIGLLRMCHPGQDSQTGCYGEAELNEARRSISSFLPLAPRLVYASICVIRKCFGYLSSYLIAYTGVCSR